ncbi:MAG: hypothetical protein AAGJ34_11155 [Pseudomonadota bacterium]
MSSSVLKKLSKGLFHLTLGTLVLTFDPQLANASDRLSGFFPSLPVGEDDALSQFELHIDGCQLVVTENATRFRDEHRYDIRSYQTVRDALSEPKQKRFSTRHLLAWPAYPGDEKRDVDALNAELWELRLGLRELLNLPEPDLRSKSQVLETWLSEIQIGAHGTFAQHNHSAQYLKSDPDILVSVRINTSMYLPAQTSEFLPLHEEVHNFRQNCD